MEQTYKNIAVEWCSAIERNRSRESQISNRRLSKRNAQVLRDIRVVLCRMSTDRATACLDRLSYSPIGCPLLEISSKDTRGRRKGEYYEGPHGRILSKHEQQEIERKKQQSGNVPTLVLRRASNILYPFLNDFPIGLRLNLSLISNGGPQYPGVGKEWATFLSVPMGHYSHCA
jgi:hypothetical protein